MVVFMVVLMAVAGRKVVLMVLLAVASLAAEIVLACLALDFAVDFEAEELLINDFFVTAIGFPPQDLNWNFCTPNMHPTCQTAIPSAIFP